MKLFYDVHMHSCLSPCGDALMTPNNIVNMCVLKGLDVIAVTDHNHSGNVAAVMSLAKESGLICIPGMEVQTKEDVHVLVYFRSLEDIERFSNDLDKYRVKVPNDEKRFGRQVICDEEDNEIATYPHALIIGLTISIEHLELLANHHQGVIVPAHINKGTNSVLANLGFMPENLNVQTIEVYDKAPFQGMMFKRYKVIRNSDAHYLGDISECEESIDVESRTLEAVFDALFINETGEEK